MINWNPKLLPSNWIVNYDHILLNNNEENYIHEEDLLLLENKHNSDLIKVISLGGYNGIFKLHALNKYYFDDKLYIVISDMYINNLFNKIYDIVNSINIEKYRREWQMELLLK